MANRKELILEETSTGCIVPVSHKLNADGYFRKQFTIDGRLRSIMYHRYVWEQTHGKIPKGYEIDHKCKNRACCNVNHLQMLTSTEHRTKDNTGRNGWRKEQARLYWMKHQCTGTLLAKMFGVSYSATCKWIRQWKKELC